MESQRFDPRKALSAETRGVIGDLKREHGQRWVCDLLGVSTPTLLRAIRGEVLMPGTCALIEMRLERRTHAEAR